MIFFKKWAKHKVKPYINCLIKSLLEKRHKKWNQECEQKQFLSFNFCNIFHLLTSRTEKIACPVDTGRKLNVHKTFRSRPGRLLNVLCTFNLRPKSTGWWPPVFKPDFYIFLFYKAYLLSQRANSNNNVSI